MCARRAGACEGSTGISVPHLGEGKEVNRALAAVCNQLCEERSPSDGAGPALWEGSVPGPVRACALQLVREGWRSLLASLRTETGPQLLTENAVPVSSLLRSPLEVSGRKGTACAAAAAPGRCFSPAGAGGDSQRLVESWALSFHWLAEHSNAVTEEQGNPGKPHIIVHFTNKK